MTLKMKQTQPGTFTVTDGADVVGTVRQVRVVIGGNTTLRWRAARLGEPEGTTNHLTPQAGVDELKPMSRPDPSSSGRLVSVVMRLPREKNEALDELAKDTRIRKSEYLREGIADLLAKHSEELDGMT